MQLPVAPPRPSSSGHGQDHGVVRSAQWGLGAAVEGAGRHFTEH